jgi:hypothetical protein
VPKNKKPHKIAVCIFIFTFTSIGALKAASEICSDQNSEYAKLITHLSKLRDSNELNKGEKCLEKVLKHKKHKSNTEFIRLYINFLLWQKKFELAKEKTTLLQKQPILQSLVKGDIKWMQGKLRLAYKEYKKAVNKKGLTFFNPGYIRKFLLCKIEAVGVEKTRIDYLVAIDAYPNSKELRNLGHALGNSSRHRISTNINGTYYNVEKSLNISKYDMKVMYFNQGYTLGLNLKKIKRSYPNQTLSDSIIGFNIGLPVDRYTIYGQVYHSINSDFSYEDMFSLQLSRKIYDRFVIGVSGERRIYLSESINIYKIFTETYLENVYLRTNIDLDFKSFLLKGRFNLHKEIVSTELWHAFGTTNSSNTFANENTFKTYGAGLVLGLINDFGIKLSYEKNIENNFDFTAYSFEGFISF